MRRSNSQAPQLEGSDTHSAAIRAARREFGAMGAAALAAWYVEDAMRGWPVVARAGAFYSQRRREMYVAFEQLHQWRGWVLGLLVVVTLAERPLWCGAASVVGRSGWAWVSGAEACPAADGGQIYLSGLPYLPLYLGAVLELLAYAYLLASSALEARWRGMRPALRSPIFSVRLALQCVAVVDTIAFVATKQSTGHMATVRLGPYVRLLLLLLTETCFTALKSISDVLGGFARVFLLLVATYVGFAFVMTMVLDDVDEKVPRCASLAAKKGGEKAVYDECPDVADGFSTFWEGVYTTMVAATNANVPAQAYPNYAWSRCAPARNSAAIPSAIL